VRKHLFQIFGESFYSWWTDELVSFRVPRSSEDVSSDVVETVISDTATWLKFRDETETETLSS